MRVLQLARTPPRWLRAALVLVALGFALNTIAHSTHQHEAAPNALHAAACAYCSAFDGLADISLQQVRASGVIDAAVADTVRVLCAPSPSIAGSLGARAPPLS